jgi:hypothetical protein
VALRAESSSTSSPATHAISNGSSSSTSGVSSGDCPPIHVSVNDDFLAYALWLRTAFARERDVYRLEKCLERFSPYLRSPRVVTEHHRHHHHNHNHHDDETDDDAREEEEEEERRWQHERHRTNDRLAALLRPLARIGGDMHVERVAMSGLHLQVCVRALRACVRACVRTCVIVCVRACVRACVADPIRSERAARVIEEVALAGCRLVRSAVGLVWVLCDALLSQPMRLTTRAILSFLHHHQHWQQRHHHHDHHRHH